MDVYTISLLVEIKDQASGTLGNIANNFQRAQKSVDGMTGAFGNLHGHLQKVQAMGAVGSEMFRDMAGFLKDMLEPAKELALQMSHMQVASVSLADQAANVKSAWAAVQNVPESSVVGALSRINEFSQILGRDKKGFAESRSLLEPSLQAQAVFQGLTGNDKLAEQQGLAILKIQEMRGKFSPNDISSAFEKFAQSAVGMQGAVLPTDKLQFIKYARSMKMSLDDEFINGGALDVLLMEMKNGKGGGSSTPGVMIQALGRTLLQGTMNKVTAGNLANMGLLTGPTLGTTTTGTTALGSIVDAALLARDPAAWTKKDFVPALEAKGFNTPEERNLAIMQLMKGAGTFTGVMQELVNKQVAFERERQNIARQKSLPELYKLNAETNPDTAFAALGNAFKDLKTAIAADVFPVIIPAMHTFAGVIQQTAGYLKDHKEVGKTLVGVAIGIGALGAGLATLGGLAAVSGAALTIGEGFGALVSLGTAAGGAIAGLGTAISAAFTYDGLAALIGWVAGISEFIPVIGWAVGGVIGLGAAVLNWGKIVDFARGHVGYLRGAFAYLLESFPPLLAAVKLVQFGMKHWSDLMGWGQGVMNFFITGFNNLMTTVVSWANKIPGIHIDAPHLALLDKAANQMADKYGKTELARLGVDDPFAFLDAPAAKSSTATAHVTHNVTVSPGAIVIHQQPGEHADHVAQKVLDKLRKHAEQAYKSNGSAAGDMSNYGIVY